MKSLIALYTMSMLVFFLGVLPAHSETGQLVMYQSGEETIEAYLATPSGLGPFPAIVVFHEWWGLNDWIKKMLIYWQKEGMSPLLLTCTVAIWPRRRKMPVR